MPIDYSDQTRAWQDQFETRALADRLAERAMPYLTANARLMIEPAEFFILATADAEGRPQVSFKGGAPGFVTIVDDKTLAFPSYDGNGMFLSLGNIEANPHVAMMFITFDKPYRWRVNGTASIDPADPLLATYPGALAVVRLAVRESFGNCPRYIPRMRVTERSKFVPREGKPAPVPRWKRLEAFQDVLPARDAAAVKAAGEPLLCVAPGQTHIDLVRED